MEAAVQALLTQIISSAFSSNNGQFSSNSISPNNNNARTVSQLMKGA